MRLESFDYGYVLLSLIIGVWQSWCFEHGGGHIQTIILVVLMGLPFALASYAHASLWPVAELPNLNRMLFLWAGMPLSIVLAALTILGESGVLHAAGVGRDNPHFFDLRLMIGEGVACLMWGICLLMWLREPGWSLSRARLFRVSAVIFAGVLLAQGLSEPIRRIFHKDISLLLVSMVATALSAFVVIFLKNNGKEAWRATSPTPES